MFQSLYLALGNASPGHLGWFVRFTSLQGLFEMASVGALKFQQEFNPGMNPRAVGSSHGLFPVAMVQAG